MSYSPIDRFGVIGNMDTARAATLNQRACDLGAAHGCNNLGGLYTYRITFSDEDHEYVGLCSEFPSLSWLAPTRDDACRGVDALVRDVVADMRARGEVVPISRADVPSPSDVR